MSNAIYHEEISSDIAASCIGQDNLREDAKYYMVSEQNSFTIIRVEANGEKTDFGLDEPDFKGYDDGFEWAKFEFEPEKRKRSAAAYIVIALIALAFLGGITCIAMLLTIF